MERVLSYAFVSSANVKVGAPHLNIGCVAIGLDKDGKI